jgi:hypothetical protein
MPVQRHRFEFTTDTGGDYRDTGPPINGMVMQVAVDTAMDTGCDFKLECVNTGVTILDWDDAGGGAWTRVPRCASFDTGGTEIGDQYFIVAHDRLRLTINQGAADTGGQSGTFYVWVGS